MTSDRCPSCGGAVRPGGPWCTLCWADLRPAPPPPPPPPPPPAAPAPVPGAPYAAAPAAPPVAAPYAAAAPVLTAPGAVDPLTAPLATVLGGPAPAQPLAAHPVADQAADPAAEQAPPVEWPCVECGTKNSIDLDTCRVCTAPFGGRILRLDDVREVRRKYMLMALGAVGVFLLLLAALTFAGTDTSQLETGPSERVVVEDPFAPTG